jgi:hypothetical protein
MPVDPFVSETPLRFRGLPDSLAASHLEASECCLIHADNPLSTSKPILLNPNVKVGYNGSAYEAVHPPELIMSPFLIYLAIWESRLRRLFSMTWVKERLVRGSVMEWLKEKKGSEPGVFCTINEMQVIMERGWKHV